MSLNYIPSTERIYDSIHASCSKKLEKISITVAWEIKKAYLRLWIYCYEGIFCCSSIKVNIFLFIHFLCDEWVKNFKLNLLKIIWWWQFRCNEECTPDSVTKFVFAVIKGRWKKLSWLFDYLIQKQSSGGVLQKRCS